MINQRTVPANDTDPWLMLIVEELMLTPRSTDVLKSVGSSDNPPIHYT